MTVNPKLTAASGVVLAGVGVYEIRRAVKEADKKKKIMHGLIGAGLILSGIYFGRKGVMQVIGLNAQKKKSDDASSPAAAIASEVAKEKESAGKKKISAREDTIRTTPLSFSDSESKNSDSFDKIMKSAGTSNIVEEQIVLKPEVSESKPRVNVKVVGQIDRNKIEEGRRIKQEIMKGITEKESEHKKIIKTKGGWGSDMAKQLRYDIAILKGKLFHV